MRLVKREMKLNFLKLELEDVIRNTMDKYINQFSLRGPVCFYRDNGDQYLTKKECTFNDDLLKTLNFIKPECRRRR